MLITQVSGQRQKVLTSLIPLGALVGIILFGSFVIYPYYLVWLTKDGSEGKVIRCDMERAWRSHIISGGTFFDHARTRTKEVSRSGKYSSKLASGNVQYGVGHKMAAVPGQRYLASVWVKASVMKNNVYLVASSVEDAENFHVRSNKLTDQEKGGWRKLVLDFSLPDALDWEELQIFISTEGHADAYFDDFEIKLLSKDDKVEEKEPQAFQAPRLEIKLSAKQYAKLDDKRKQAFRDGVLLSDEDSWAKGKLLVGGEELPIKTRLKGDWLDHLRGDKWSFRVKVKGAYAWDGLKTFSLHNPSARYFLWEWMIHKLFEREDVLTTTYDFAELTFNGKSLGIYAYEEHFEKQLVESRKRREGPIVRFSEDALWKYRARAIQAIGYFKKDFVHPSSYPKQAEIKAFKEGKTAGSENLSKQFEIAQTLMYQMQQGEAPASEIFDLKRLARFFAISDMMGAWHGLVWHNIRYYYNPVISKLEPIGYDNFNDKPRKPLILGKMPKLDHTPVYADPSRLLFLDEAFMEAYVEELLRLSSEEYLEEFVQEIRPGLKQRLLFLQKEYPKFNMSVIEILERSKLVKAAIMPYQEYSVKVEWLENTDKGKLLKLRNLHLMPLWIMGYASGDREDDEEILQEPLMLLPAPNSRDTLYKLLELPEDTHRVLYRLPGIDSVFSAQVPTWRLSTDKTPFQYLFERRGLKSNAMYEVEIPGKLVRFRKGKHTVKSRIVIPSGYKVVFDPGVQLDFMGASFFISRGAVEINGTEEEPVVFRSLDHKARGFTVLQSPEKSTVRHAVFEGFNTLDIDGWKLTGAVTFYESDVDISNSIFRDNVCEDGLNVIRSKVLFEKSKIYNTFADGFDLDFCQGTIRSSYFEDTGNDGVDASGSQIDLQQCSFRGCGDKAVSVGENSQVEIGYASIEGAVIGVASKDLSTLRIRDISLRDCNQGFAAYQKKPEFGPSRIIVDNYKAEEVRYLYTIAPGSKLRLMGKLIGEEEDLQ